MDYYFDYVFDVLLPFLTDLMELDFETACNVYHDETRYIEEYDWTEYADTSYTPEFLKFDSS
jgi:hypothetical protein